MTRTDTVPVDPANAGALHAWDGDEGEYWSANERIYDGSLRRYRQPLFEAAAITTTDRVLDIGCGTGETTRDAATIATQGSALGIDLSSRMLDVARRRAKEQGLTNATFMQADAQIHPFEPGTFDVAISRTGTMFFGDAVAAFTNIRNALRGGGRLTILVWQEVAKNHWVRDFVAALTGGRGLPAAPPEAPGPFSFADPRRGRHVLTAAGFADIDFAGVEQLMWFGDSPEEAFRFVRGLGLVDSLLRNLDDSGQQQAIAALHASIETHATDDGVLYPSAAWIITARA